MNIMLSKYTLYSNGFVTYGMITRFKRKLFQFVNKKLTQSLQQQFHSCYVCVETSTCYVCVETIASLTIVFTSILNLMLHASGHALPNILQFFLASISDAHVYIFRMSTRSKFQYSRKSDLSLHLFHFVIV
uniref:Uncharacterized protein n=1 Tax=Glossina austeni TaxID=7395 RepID=A0A1A9UED5_GLOAU